MISRFHGFVIFYDFSRKLFCNNLLQVIDDKQLATMNFVFCEVAVKLWLVIITQDISHGNALACGPTCLLGVTGDEKDECVFRDGWIQEHVLGRWLWR